MRKKQPTKRRLYLRSKNTERTAEGFVAAIQLVDQATDEVVWERSGFVKRVGPLRFDNSVMGQQRAQLWAYLRKHTEDVELCDPIIDGVS